MLSNFQLELNKVNLDKCLRVIRNSLEFIFVCYELFALKMFLVLHYFLRYTSIIACILLN